MIKLEQITWIDSGLHFATGWHSLQMVEARAKAFNGRSYTTGWNVYEDEQVVVLAQTLEEEKPNVAGAWAIYKPCIESRATLLEIEWSSNGD